MSIDFLDFSQELLSTTAECISLSKEYLNSRKKHAECFNKLIVLINKAGLEKSKKQIDNKIAELLSHQQYGEDARKIYEHMLMEEANYKGLEQVCKAYNSHSVAICAVLKSQQQGEINENMKNKYSKGEIC